LVDLLDAGGHIEDELVARDVVAVRPGVDARRVHHGLEGVDHRVRAAMGVERRGREGAAVLAPGVTRGLGGRSGGVGPRGGFAVTAISAVVVIIVVVAATDERETRRPGAECCATAEEGPARTAPSPELVPVFAACH